MREGAAPEQSTEGTLRERRTFGLIVLVGVAALFFGVLQILNTIRFPFSSVAKNANAGLGETGTIIAELSGRDTDSDGLTDFDELYAHNTSPYLADSDSDGKNDQQEILGGTDPNCPGNDVCSALSLTAPTNTSAGNENGNTNGSGTAQSALDAQALRIALQNAGAPAATLQQLDDAALLALYQEIIGTPPTANANASETNGNTNAGTQLSVDLEALGDLTPDQMREFLKLGGADEASLSELDDDTLRLIFEEALRELNATL